MGSPGYGVPPTLGGRQPYQAGSYQRSRRRAGGQALDVGKAGREATKRALASRKARPQGGGVRQRLGRAQRSRSASLSVDLSAARTRWICSRMLTVGDSPRSSASATRARAWSCTMRRCSGV